MQTTPSMWKYYNKQKTKCQSKLFSNNQTSGLPVPAKDQTSPAITAQSLRLSVRIKVSGKHSIPPGNQ